MFTSPSPSTEPIVITGIGMINSLGNDRETAWESTRLGKSAVRRIEGLNFIENGLLIGATVDHNPSLPNFLKIRSMCLRAAEEAVHDARIRWSNLDLTRVGCSVSGHVSDLWDIERRAEQRADDSSEEMVPWHEQFLPSTACSDVGSHFELGGPRICHSVACASGSVEVMAATRAIRSGDCDMMIAGSGEIITPLFAAGFRKMRVLAEDENPEQACRPFDRTRKGFVMGEGSAFFVIERLSHALKRNARIYAEIVAGHLASEGQHITDLDHQSEALAYTINQAVRKAKISPSEIDYINVHGTGTAQNDLAEANGLKRAFGKAACQIPVSANKSNLGHLVNAAGSTELAITALALRDGFLPPTINLNDPDPACDLEHVAITGRRLRPQIALKTSVAFGGHLVAVILRRWNDAHHGFGYPEDVIRKVA
ncbi:Beta-ketoacyl-[acyl-carrier-protein] synthase II [Planctomycetales bacterium 10988]|nr:Beta-ketoacyl-[acyl-carrier-protein] synthase II [Planctomycetales bacterium 10988]